MVFCKGEKKLTETLNADPRIIHPGYVNIVNRVYSSKSDGFLPNWYFAITVALAEFYSPDSRAIGVLTFKCSMNCPCTSWSRGATGCCVEPGLVQSWVRVCHCAAWVAWRGKLLIVVSQTSYDLAISSNSTSLSIVTPVKIGQVLSYDKSSGFLLWNYATVQFMWIVFWKPCRCFEACPITDDGRESNIRQTQCTFKFTSNVS